MDKYVGLLQELADKYGTTVEHLWEVLIRQAYIDSMTSIGLFITGGICLCFGWYYFFYKKNKVWDKVKGTRRLDKDPIQTIALTILLGFSLMITIGFFKQIDMIIAGIINPEYWALMKLRG